MSRHRFYRPGIDTVEPIATPVIRYGEPHTVSGPYRVQPSSSGGWEVMGRLNGPTSYGGMLVTRVVQPCTVDGRINLTFRLKRDAAAALRAYEASTAKVAA